MEAGNLYVRFGVDVSALKSGLAEAKGALSRFGSDMQSAGATLTTAISIPLAAAGGWAIKLAGQLEATALSFRVLTKDAAAAALIQKQLNDYADKSPFSSEDVVMAGKRLVAYRFAVKDVLPYLKDAGDLAAAFADQGVKVADTAAVFGRLKSGDFGEAFERLRDFGVSRELLEGKGLKFDKSGEYKGSVQEALAAVRAIIQENYGGMADALGTTLPGMLATAKDTIERFAQDIGKALVENFDVKQLIGDFTNFVNGLRESFNNLSPAAQKFALSLGALAVALPPIALAIGSIVTAMPVLAAGFAAVTGPIGLVSAAVVLLAANWDTVKQKAYEALYSMGKWAGEALVKLGEKVGSQTLVNEGKAQLAKSASFRGTYLPQQSGASVVGDQSLAEDIREAKKAQQGLVKTKEAAKGLSEQIRQVVADTQKLFDILTEASRNRMTDQMRKEQQLVIDDADKRKREIEDSVASAKLKQVAILAVEEETQRRLQAIRKKYATDSASISQGGVSSESGKSNVSGVSGTDIKKATSSLPGYSQWYDTNIQPAVDGMKTLLGHLNEFNMGLKQTLNDAAATMFEGFGEIVGAMLSGTSNADNLSKLLLTSLAGVVTNFGRLAIQIGVGMMGIKAAFSSLNPFLAISAGVALIALGSAFRASANNIGGKMGGGKTRSYASGWGGAYGPTNMVFGDHAGRSVDNPEYVLRHDQVKSILNRAADNAGGGRGGFIAETVIRGADLRVLLKRAEAQASN